MFGGINVEDIPPSASKKRPLPLSRTCSSSSKNNHHDANDPLNGELNHGDETDSRKRPLLTRMERMEITRGTAFDHSGVLVATGGPEAFYQYQQHQHPFQPSSQASCHSYAQFLFLQHSQSEGALDPSKHGEDYNGQLNNLPAESEKSSKAKRSWKRVCEYVKSGEFLLQTTSLREIEPPLPGVVRGEQHGGIDTNDRSVEEILFEKEREKVRKRRQAQLAFRRNLNFTPAQCLGAIFILLCISIIAFSYLFHKWTIIDSIYFAVATFSTVGYGDIAPQSTLARLFTCFYAISGVTALGIILGVISTNVVEAQERAIEEIREVNKNKAMFLFSHAAAIHAAAMNGNSKADAPQSNTEIRPPLTKNLESFNSINSSSTNTSTALLLKGLKTDDSRKDGGSRNKTKDDIHDDCEVIPNSKFFRIPGKHVLSIISVLIGLIIMTVFGFIVAQDPAITASNAVYFLIITSTTCGFGDIAPITQQGRLATAIFIPFAVAGMGHWLTTVSAWIIRRRQTEFQRNIEANGLTLADLEAMDEDEDGNVSRVEFLEFMLLAMNKVSRELLDDLRNHFDRLDADGSGLISKEDLVMVAKRNLRRPSRKLTLARYKEKLKQQAEAAKQNSGFWESVSQQPHVAFLFAAADGAGCMQIQEVQRQQTDRPVRFEETELHEHTMEML